MHIFEKSISLFQRTINPRILCRAESPDHIIKYPEKEKPDVPVCPRANGFQTAHLLDQKVLILVRFKRHIAAIHHTSLSDMFQVIKINLCDPSLTIPDIVLHIIRLLHHLMELVRLCQSIGSSIHGNA